MAKQRRHWLGIGMLYAALTFNAAATDYVFAPTSGNWSWTNSSSWSPAGVPGLADNVTCTNLPWAASWNLNLNASWAAGSITCTTRVEGINNHNLNPNADGTAIVIRAYNDANSGNSFWWQQNNSTRLTLTEFHDLGLHRFNMSFGGPVSAYWSFVGAARIVYHTTESDLQNLAVHLDFTNASSVLLERSPRQGTVTKEVIKHWGGNGENYMLAIGRSDNGTQAWSVGAGAHPLLVCTPGTGRQTVSKVGAGDVDMPDIDLRIDMTTLDAAINTSGSGWSIPSTNERYQGRITANSLTVSNAAASGSYLFNVGGHLRLDGQAGQQAGAAPNGHAFHLRTANANLEGFATLGQWFSVPCRIEVTPQAGDFCLESTGSGTVWFRICEQSRDNAGRDTNAVLTVKTLNLASTNSYLTDRCRFWDFDSRAGGVIEFYDHFLNASRMTNDCRLDFSTLRKIPGGTNYVGSLEVASRDLGATDPGTQNFAMATLVLGQTAAGATGTVRLHLQDEADNHTQDASPEALYVTNLAMYADSILFLNGGKLYYKNSGSWQQAKPGPYPYGDGTGHIVAWWPAKGTIIMLK